MPVEVQTFSSPFGKARVVMFSDGTPWFVAKDVCEGLGFSIDKGVTNHLLRLDKAQKQTLSLSRISNAGLIRDLGGHKVRFLVLITRGGFNDMVLESRKPVAREYRQWVTDKVLPALQDTGTFTL
ncbi:BRO-N domain-containing protein [Paracoccus everestensis]|uniref:BRO-N domain-containing protein n=1 Tax=Paracoccus everestensis TaxID=2903900 RepID=UPI001F3F7DE0|nr:Bro-N domain-containing protein [Paracoccus everestensis]